MKSTNGSDREDRNGVDRFRAAIEDVALELESRGTTEKAPPRAPWFFRPVFAATVVLIALLIGTWWIVPRRSSEVEVLVLRVQGRDVRARIVDDTGRATILVMPQPPSTRPAGAAAVALGGAR